MLGRGLKRPEQFGHDHPELAVMAVLVGRAADADGRHQLLAVQLVAAGAIGPAVPERRVLPLLEQGGGAVPVHRELPDHAVRGEQRLLLGLGVDVEVGVERVLVAHGHARGGGGRFRQRPVDARTVMQMRMEDQNQSVHSYLLIIVAAWSAQR